jgi:hypothetical protein
MKFLLFKVVFAARYLFTLKEGIEPNALDCVDSKVTKLGGTVVEKFTVSPILLVEFPQEFSPQFFEENFPLVIVEEDSVVSI